MPQQQLAESFVRLYQEAMQKYPTQITPSLLRCDKATKKSHAVKNNPAGL